MVNSRRKHFIESDDDDGDDDDGDDRRMTRERERNSRRSKRRRIIIEAEDGGRGRGGDDDDDDEWKEEEDGDDDEEEEHKKIKIKIKKKKKKKKKEKVKERGEKRVYERDVYTTATTAAAATTTTTANAANAATDDDDDDDDGWEEEAEGDGDEWEEEIEDNPYASTSASVSSVSVSVATLDRDVAPLPPPLTDKYSSAGTIAMIKAMKQSNSSSSACRRMASRGVPVASTATTTVRSGGSKKKQKVVRAFVRRNLLRLPPSDLQERRQLVRTSVMEWEMRELTMSGCRFASNIGKEITVHYPSEKKSTLDWVFAVFLSQRPEHCDALLWPLLFDTSNKKKQLPYHARQKPYYAVLFTAFSGDVQAKTAGSAVAIVGSIIRHPCAIELAPFLLDCLLRMHSGGQATGLSSCLDVIDVLTDMACENMWDTNVFQDVTKSSGSLGQRRTTITREYLMGKSGTVVDPVGLLIALADQEAERVDTAMIVVPRVVPRLLIKELTIRTLQLNENVTSVSSIFGGMINRFFSNTTCSGSQETLVRTMLLQSNNTNYGNAASDLVWGLSSSLTRDAFTRHFTLPVLEGVGLSIPASLIVFRRIFTGGCPTFNLLLRTTGCGSGEVRLDGNDGTAAESLLAALESPRVVVHHSAIMSAWKSAWSGDGRPRWILMETLLRLYVSSNLAMRGHIESIFMNYLGDTPIGFERAVAIDAAHFFLREQSSLRTSVNTEDDNNDIIIPLWNSFLLWASELPAERRTAAIRGVRLDLAVSLVDPASYQARAVVLKMRRSLVSNSDSDYPSERFKSSCKTILTEILIKGVVCVRGLVAILSSPRAFVDARHAAAEILLRSVILSSERQHGSKNASINSAAFPSAVLRFVLPLAEAFSGESMPSVAVAMRRLLQKIFSVSSDRDEKTTLALQHAWEVLVRRALCTGSRSDVSRSQCSGLVTELLHAGAAPRHPALVCAIADRICNDSGGEGGRVALELLCSLLRSPGLLAAAVTSLNNNSVCDDDTVSTALASAVRAVLRPMLGSTVTTTQSLDDGSELALRIQVACAALTIGNCRGYYDATLFETTKKVVTVLHSIALNALPALVDGLCHPHQLVRATSLSALQQASDDGSSNYILTLVAKRMRTSVHPDVERPLLRDVMSLLRGDETCVKGVCMI